jgi:hypothetical protein
LKAATRRKTYVGGVRKLVLEQTGIAGIELFEAEPDLPLRIFGTHPLRWVPMDVTH